MLILTDTTGREIRRLEFTKFDCDLTDTKDFELIIPVSKYEDDFIYGARVFVPNTEFGGIIGTRETNTENSSVTLKGHSWRGYLSYKRIIPAAGQDYKTVTGELNDIIRQLISDCQLSGLFYVPQVNSSQTVTFQFDRYCTLYKGIEKMLNSVGYKMQIKYKQMEQNQAGYVEIQAVPIVDYSETVEFSQDSNLNFTLAETMNKVNHLICLGSGQLAQRQVLHLYIDQNGNVSHSQYYFGINEIVDIYDFANVESASELETSGTERLLEISNTKEFNMAATNFEQEVGIGDIVGGRDYITGISIAKPVTNKIYTEEEGIAKIEYSVEGINEDDVIID